MASVVHGGRFDFDDGGTYCGGWEDGKAHGYGVCTGPKSLGEFTGFWQFGYEVSGVYLWPSGNRYEGQWMSGKRHGLGAERKGRWVYKGEWTQGFKGRYGVRVSEKSGARYEGTWANGLQDGYGREVYADGGTYLGQISQGLRSGYGVRQSVPYGVATRYRLKEISESLTSLRSTAEEENQITIRRADKDASSNRGGFVLKPESREFSTMHNAQEHVPNRHRLADNPTERQNSLTKAGRNLKRAIMCKLRKQKSAGDVNIRPSSMKQRGKIEAFKSGYGQSVSVESYDSQRSVKTCPEQSIDDYREMSVTTQQESVSTVPNRFELATSPTLDLYGTADDAAAMIDPNLIESYMGEWKADRRTGLGIADRSDGLRYEGEWLNNKRDGYGVTTFPDGTREEGKYRDNVLVTSQRRLTRLLSMRTSKMRQRALFAANNAISAAQTAHQKAEIAISRANNARAKAQAAEVSAKHSLADSDMARQRAREIAPEFKQPGLHQACRDPIILDIDINPTSEHFNSVLHERISTTLPYPTGLDYTTGVPGVSAATLYGFGQPSINFGGGTVEEMHALPQPVRSPTGMYSIHNGLPILPSGSANLNEQLDTSMDKHEPYVMSGHLNVASADNALYGHKVDLSSASIPNYQQPYRQGFMISIGDRLPVTSQQPDAYYQHQGLQNTQNAQDYSQNKAFVDCGLIDDQAQLSECGKDDTVLRRQNYWQSRTQKPTQPPRTQMSVDSPPFYRDTLCEAPSPHIRRRKSLPCIIRVDSLTNEQIQPTGDITTPSSASPPAIQLQPLCNTFITKGMAGKHNCTIREESPPLPPLSFADQIPPLVIDDDGVRKRIVELGFITNKNVDDLGQIKRNSSEEWDESPELPKKVILKQVEDGRRLSIPENITHSNLKGLSRSEICYLSTRRREEIRRTQYLRENPILHIKIFVGNLIRKYRVLLALLVFTFVALWICKGVFSGNDPVGSSDDA